MKNLRRSLCTIICLILFPLSLNADPGASLTVRELRYEAKLTDNEARFGVNLDLEAAGKGEAILPLFHGNLAVLTTKLPANLRLLREGSQYCLVAARAGHYKFALDLVAKVTRQDLWNQVSFDGPDAPIASLLAQAGGAGTEVQLLSGIVQEAATKDGVTLVRGFLGRDHQVSLRWSRERGPAEPTHKALLTCGTTAVVQVTPTVVKYDTQLRYEILQGSAAQLGVVLPASQALTKLQGDGVRDWQLKPLGTATNQAGQQLLTVEFIKPIEKSFTLTLLTEQTVESTAAAVAIMPPQPQEVERETGSLTVAAEDVVVETDSLSGLRQVNADRGALAAYQFYTRPFILALKIRRIEPVVNTDDRVTVHWEESRLVVNHDLNVTVEKAGVYALDLMPPAGFTVADVHGEGLEDWKMNAGKLALTFNSRVLGSRRIEVQLEQAFPATGNLARTNNNVAANTPSMPGEIAIKPLHVAGAVRETAQIGAAAAAGLQLKTVTVGLTGVREIPVNRLANRTDELLAYNTDQADWVLTITAERLAARITADLFNLVSIGDGLLGGSATIRYAIINQGVQEFQVRVPSRWKNVEFTGPNIRRKEQQDDVWTISLQEKAWGGYTLVVTYDYQFDPHKASLALGGIHCENVERETGSIAITSASDLQLQEVKHAGVTPATEGASDVTALDRIDESELNGDDRALVTRPVLMAYRYAGRDYNLDLDVNRFEGMPVLDAAADRTQLTTVLTEDGQMLTQASFMVKNNDRQFQTFTMPAGADFWSCYISGEPVKPERNGSRLLVPLPRQFNRDQAFPVDIVYVQKIDPLKNIAPRQIALAAPQTDMQTTYAEWELYAPTTLRLAGFGGNMIVAPGLTYGLRDAWRECARFYGLLQTEPPMIFISCLALVILVMAAVLTIRRRWLIGGLFVTLAGIIGLVVLNSARRQYEIASFSGISSPGVQSLNSLTLGTTVNNGNFFVGRSGSIDNSLTVTNASVWQTGGSSDVSDGSKKGAGGNVLYNDGHSPYASALILNGVNDQRGSLGDSGGTVAPEPAAPPMVAGIRPIRIEIPRTGQRLVFTKVLNVRAEPLVIRASAMDQRVFNDVRASAQGLALFVGLALIVWQVLRARPNSLFLAIGLTLVLGAGASWLLSCRMLHVALILAGPVVVLAGCVWLVLVLWEPKAPTPKQDGEAAGPSPDVGLPPAGGTTAATTILVVLMLLWSGVGTQAAEVVSIVSATYTGAVHALDSKVATVGQFEAVLTLSADSDNLIVPLFNNEVAVEEFSATPKTVILQRDDRGVSVLIPRKGTATVHLKFLVKTTGDAAGWRVGFAIPAALISRVAVTLDEPEAQVDVPPAVSFESTTAGQQTTVNAILGASDKFELTWTPRMKRAADVTTTVFCNNAALVTVAGGAIDLLTTLDYQATQGELRQLRVTLPVGQHLMRVAGEAIRTWKLDGQILTVELTKGGLPNDRLIVETELSNDVGGGTNNTVILQIPHAVEVQRETGLVALSAADELSVAVAGKTELQKVDVNEFPPLVTAWPGVVTSVYRFFKPDFTLALRVAPVQPQVEALVRNHARVTTEQVLLRAVIDYTIKRAGVFTLRLALPDDYRVEAVQGDKIAQWVEKPGAPRVLEVTLKERTSGAYNLSLDLARSLKELPQMLDITGVQPLDTQKLNGFVSATAEEGVQIRSESFDGLSEVPAMSLEGAPQSVGVLGFKLIPGDSGSIKAPWKLTVSTEKIESWVRAEIRNTVTLSDVLVSGESVVRYDVANAPTKEFRVRVPARFHNVEVAGANIRRKDHDDQTGEWHVELQSKVSGVYELTVTWDMPWDAKSGSLEIVGIEAPGVERETGSVAIKAPAKLRVETKSMTADLQGLDPRELPEFATAAGKEMPVLAFRYLRPGFQLTLATQRFDEAEVLQAIVDRVNLTTVVSEDGQLMTEMALEVRNNARQYLEIALPPGATNVWSAFVGGQPVRPSVRNGKLLLPMERSQDDAPVPVEITYVGDSLFPSSKGMVELPSPALDVPLKNAHWDLYLPPDYTYGHFAGTMQREAATAQVEQESTPVMRSYGLNEYAAEENRKQVVEESETRTTLSNARAELANGNVQGANNYFNRARGKTAIVADADYQQLAKDIQHAQANKMMEGNQTFITQNGGQVISSSGSFQMGLPLVAQTQQSQFNPAAAEQQAAKVQAAQEVAVSKAMPLRVNLPKRGVYFAFSQVIQTQPGKPMSVKFSAVSERGTDWPARLGCGALAFLALWGVTALISANRVYSKT